MGVQSRWVGIVAIVGLLFGAVLPVQGQSNKPIILEMPLYHSVGQLWLDQANQIQGVRTKLLRALNRQLAPAGIQLRYRLTPQGELPIKRCLKELSQGEYDAYLGLGESQERREMGIQYSTVPLYTVPNVIWMHKDRLFTIENREDLKGKRIGVLKGGAFLTGSHHQEDMTIDRSATHPRQNIQKLIHDRLDLVIDPLTRTGTVVIEEGVKDQIRYCLYCLPPSEAHIGYSPFVPESIRTKVDEAIHRLQISGEIQHLLVGKVLEQLEGSQIDTP